MMIIITARITNQDDLVDTNDLIEMEQHIYTPVYICGGTSVWYDIG